MKLTSASSLFRPRLFKKGTWKGLGSMQKMPSDKRTRYSINWNPRQWGVIPWAKWSELFHLVCVQGLNFMRMSARVDGVASRVQSAIQMRQVRVASFPSSPMCAGGSLGTGLGEEQLGPVP